MTTTKYALKDVRNILDASVAELAEMSGLSESTIYRIEREANNQAVNDHTVTLLCEALGVSADEIRWPNGITDGGRRPLTGGTYTVTRSVVSRNTETTCTVCPKHFITIPVATGICDFCS